MQADPAVVILRKLFSRSSSRRCGSALRRACLCAAAMSGQRPQTRPLGAPWQQATALRVDEYGRRARQDLFGGRISPQLDEEATRVVQQRLSGPEGEGLRYTNATASSSSSGPATTAAAWQVPAVASNLAMSFEPARHVFYVLGRPCMVLMRARRFHSKFIPSLEPTAEAAVSNGAPELTAETIARYLICK